LGVGGGGGGGVGGAWGGGCAVAFLRGRALLGCLVREVARPPACAAAGSAFNRHRHRRARSPPSPPSSPPTCEPPPQPRPPPPPPPPPTCLIKISLSRLWPQGLYLRLNLSNLFTRGGRGGGGGSGEGGLFLPACTSPNEKLGPQRLSQPQSQPIPPLHLWKVSCRRACPGGWPPNAYLSPPMLTNPPFTCGRCSCLRACPGGPR
jgi:hypothetical protein